MVVTVVDVMEEIVVEGLPAIHAIDLLILVGLMVEEAMAVETEKPKKPNNAIHRTAARVMPPAWVRWASSESTKQPSLSPFGRLSPGMGRATGSHR